LMRAICGGLYAINRVPFTIDTQLLTGVLSS
jgi:hypothetical protein